MYMYMYTCTCTCTCTCIIKHIRLDLRSRPILNYQLKYFAISGVEMNPISNKKQRKYKHKAQLNDFISQTTITY